MKTEAVIGRSRTGDQLHLCHWVDFEQEGRKPYISDNARCNQRMHLRPISGFRSEEKVTVKLRPGLLCVKCFGTDTARITAHAWHNAVVTE
jgi:hypothetical protein